MALGATPRRILILTLREAGTPVAAGLGTGLIAGILVGRVLQKLVYGIQAVDSSLMFIVASFFLAAAVTAALLPAHRAALVDPMEALRSE